MLKPTQDTKLKERLIQMADSVSKVADWDYSETRSHENRVRFIEMVLQEIEGRGYHVGLPSSVEEALNSGDGVYRP